MSCWYKPKELSKRIALFYTASLTAGAFGGLLAGGIIEKLEGVAGTRGWQWLFIIEGLITVAVACVSFFVLPNYPTTTKWLSIEEKRLAVARLLSADSTGDEDPHMTHWTAFKLACKDPKTWVFVVIYNLLNMVGTISYFFPSLMTTLGHKGRMAQFMTVPIYAVALIISVSLGFVADRTGKKAYVVMAACALATLSFVIVVAQDNKQVKYAFICFGGGGIWTAVPVFLSWMVTMFDGREKRAVCIALVNGFGNLASVYGSFFWPKSNGPKYVIGFSLTTAFCGVALLVTMFAKWKFGDKGVARTS
jgi:MFS family permease